MSPDDTFLAYLDTNGIEIALIIEYLPDQEASKERQYQFDPKLMKHPTW